jgi:glutathione S-transferase
MKLYYSKGTCALAIRITINELNIPCDFEAVQLKDKKTASGGDFLKINPKGVVPVLQLDNGEILTENVAIQIYLADQYKAAQLLPPLGEMKRYHVIEWLSFVGSDLHKSCGPLFNADVPAPIKESIFKPILKSKLVFLDKHFSQHDYLVGNAFTLPDGYLFVVLTWMHHFDISLSQWPHLERYFNTIKARASVQKSLAEGG